MGFAIGLRVAGLTSMINGLGGKQQVAVKEALRIRLTTLSEEVAGRAKFYIRGSRLSNPKELLGVVSGHLRRSITPLPVQERGGMLVGIVAVQKTPYAPVHEFGLKVGKRQYPPRPFLTRALKDWREKIRKELGEAYIEATKKSIRKKGRGE